MTERLSKEWLARDFVFDDLVQSSNPSSIMCANPSGSTLMRAGATGAQFLTTRGITLNLRQCVSISFLRSQNRIPAAIRRSTIADGIQSLASDGSASFNSIALINENTCKASVESEVGWDFARL